MDPPSQSYLDGMSGVGQLLLENEKTKRKLRKVQQRRDYYARQYFQTLSQLEQVRAELAHAVNTIRELTGRDQSAAGNPSGRPPAHSNNTTPDSGTSISPGSDAMDGRSQTEGRDQRDGPSSLFWSYDSSRAAALYRSPGAVRRGPVEKLPPQSRILPPQLQLLQQHRDALPPRRLEKHSHSNQNSTPHQTSPTRHRNPTTLPASLTIKDSNFNSHQSAFSKPHLPQSPLQRRPPINPTFAPSTQTLPHYQHQQNLPRKPAFQRSMTLPHSYTAPSLKAFSSGMSDDEEEEDDEREERRQPRTATSNLTASNSSVILSPSATTNLQIESTTSEPSLLLHMGACPDQTHSLSKQLSRTELMSLFADIGSPHCNIQKLEIRASRLGEKQLMALFCSNLAPNSSITELSLPDNGIGREALSLLLNTVRAKPGLKELKLCWNHIGEDCAAIIKDFLTHTTLDSLVLTGNEIQQHSHVMDGQLPSDFSIEYFTDGSEDSGVHSVPVSAPTSEPSPQPHHITSSFKYLRI